MTTTLAPHGAEPGSGLTPGRAKLLLNLSFAAIVAHTVFGWYDVHSAFASGGEPASLVLRVGTMLPAMLAFGLLVLYRTRFRLPRPWGGILRWSAVTFAIGMLIGLSQFHLPRYLLGDAFRYGISWASLYVCLVASFSLVQTSPRTAERYFDAFLLIAVADAAATYWLSRTFPHARISTSAYVFAILWGLINLERRPLVAILAFLIGTWSMLVGGKRGPFIAIPPVAAVAVFLLVWSGRPVVARAIRFLCYTGAGVVVAVVLMWVTTSWSPGARRFTAERARVLTGDVATIAGDARRGKAAGTYEGRLDEMDNVFLYFGSNPFAVPVGAGFGIEVPMVHDTGVASLTGKMHHVHMAWGAYLLRNGVNGVLLLGCYFLVLIAYAARMRAPYGKYAIFACAMGAWNMIMAFKGNMMLEAIPMVIALAVALAHADAPSEAEGGVAHGEAARHGLPGDPTPEDPAHAQ